MLRYFLEGLDPDDLDVTVATAADNRVSKSLPEYVRRISIPDNQPFSLRVLLAQLAIIGSAHRATPFDVIHGWAARDWELTSAAAWKTGRPGVGTLHDHPRAGFITAKRQMLMRCSARWGLTRVICVSEAVRSEVLEEGVAPTKAVTIRNGTPSFQMSARASRNPVLRLGYLGGFSERKGIGILFQMIERLASDFNQPWELTLAGDALDSSGALLISQIKERYCNAAWWTNVSWPGWVSKPHDFLSSLDLLICPSTEFDPFPTVLLEAGATGTPVLASNIGGVPEIVEDGVTGWLFAPGDFQQAADLARAVLSCRETLVAAGNAAKTRVINCFSMSQMTAHYRSQYAELCASNSSRK